MPPGCPPPLPIPCCCGTRWHWCPLPVPVAVGTRGHSGGNKDTAVGTGTRQWEWGHARRWEWGHAGNPTAGLSQTPGHDVPTRAGQGKGSAPLRPRPTHRAAGPAPGSPTHGGAWWGRGSQRCHGGAPGGGWGGLMGTPTPPQEPERAGGTIPPSPPPQRGALSHHCPPPRVGPGGVGFGVWGSGGANRLYSPSRRGGRSRGASGGSSRRALPERSGRGWERKINHPRG